MKNKVELKKCLFKALEASICLLVIFLIINIYEYHEYKKNFNKQIFAIVDKLQDEYPNLTEEEIVQILNSNGKDESSTLKKYSINLNAEIINQKKYPKFLIINISILILGIVIIITIFITYIKKTAKNINEITKYIEQLNKKNYSLKIDSNSEDELSILKNELYKTVVMLKENAENSQKDKLNLKTSLEDISHQLKTPLTSILIMLDNLIEDQNMTDETKNYFLRDIKRNIINLNFLVQSLLKLSKFDSNTIIFTKKENSLRNIIKKASKNLSTLCDLKNIKLNITGQDDIKITCDFNWQVEAITNIIKNSVEHSSINSKIDIFFEQNNAYILLTIKDYGSGIAKEDLQNIFKRFYHGQTSSFESIGIGLSLAKVIIENDNGLINVKTTPKGTTFIIKYFQ